MKRKCKRAPHHAGHTHPLGIEGWRFAFLTVAAVSVAIGVATFFLAHDPRFASDSQVRLKQLALSSARKWSQGRDPRAAINLLLATASMHPSARVGKEMKRQYVLRALLAVPRMTRRAVQALR